MAYGRGLNTIDYHLYRSVTVIIDKANRVFPVFTNGPEYYRVGSSAEHISYNSTNQVLYD